MRRVASRLGDEVVWEVLAAQTRVLMAGWELFSGVSADQDDARVGLLAALAGRLNDAIMLMVARWRRGEGDRVMPALVLGGTLATVSSGSVVPYSEWFELHLFWCPRRHRGKRLPSYVKQEVVITTQPIAQHC